MEPIGCKCGSIAEGYIPSQNYSFSHRAFICREPAFCILNAGDHDTHMRVTAFFVGREPVGSYDATVTAPHIASAFQRSEGCAPIPCDADNSRCSNPTSRSFCNTRGSIHVTPSQACVQRWLVHRRDSICRMVPAGTQRN